MRLSDRLIDANRRLDRENKKRDEKQQEPEEDEQGYAYQSPPKWGYLNDYRGVFTDSAVQGINTAQSVFDRTALFRTGTGTGGEDGRERT